ncbi:MAG: MBL fold metallo-hydrolase [Treponema sp.]|jgi:glyoxylase-like metal-dependent hydrolase (beta-lactamase superfamily II)|nr:MBL fold metallo-hydrolase [Treponema sp.]
MKLFFHYCSYGFSNCYVLGSDPPEERGALIIDPAVMDKHILGFLENNDYPLLGVLVTHDHIKHVRGLRTLKRIYETKVFAINPHINEHRTTMVRDGDNVSIGPFKVEVIATPGHSSDSAVFRVDRLLFTGDSLSAGLVGRTASAYGAAVQMTALRSKILSLPGDFTILPAHGPPSTLEAERRYNDGISAFDEIRSRRPKFKLDLS